MEHCWKHADFLGTKGWHRCARCGTRCNSRNEPSADYNPRGQTCDETIHQKAERMRLKIESLLHTEDADTSQIWLVISLKVSDTLSR